MSQQNVQDISEMKKMLQMRNQMWLKGRQNELLQKNMTVTMNSLQAPTTSPAVIPAPAPSHVASASSSNASRDDLRNTTQAVLNVLSHVEEQVRSQVKEQIQEQLLKEKRKLHSFIKSEIESDHTCEICYEAMFGKEREPTLLYPCGHTFCKQCILTLEKERKKSCAMCRQKFEKYAPNIHLKKLIENFVEKKKSLDAAAEMVPAKSSSSQSASVGEMLRGVPEAHVENVEKYIREYNKYKVRLEILHNELDHFNNELERTTMQHYEAAQDAKEIQETQAYLNEQIELIMKKLEELHVQYKQKTSQLEELDSAKQTMKKKIELIELTIQSLKTHQDKSRLIIRSFLPTWTDNS